MWNAKQIEQSQLYRVNPRYRRWTQAMLHAVRTRFPTQEFVAAIAADLKVPENLVRAQASRMKLRRPSNSPKPPKVKPAPLPKPPKPPKVKVEHRTRTKWTKTQSEALLAEKGILTNEQLAQKLGKTVSAVVGRHQMLKHRGLLATEENRQMEGLRQAHQEQITDKLANWRPLRTHRHDDFINHYYDRW